MLPPSSPQPLRGSGVGQGVVEDGLNGHAKRPRHVRLRAHELVNDGEILAQRHEGGHRGEPESGRRLRDRDKQGGNVPPDLRLLDFDKVMVI